MKKAFLSREALVFGLILSDDLFLVVGSAVLADSVRHHECSALAALN